MTAQPRPQASFEYRLQREPVGVVVLDAARRVMAANPWAASLLSRGGTVWLGADILDLHPEPARAKVRWLLDTALGAPDQPAGMVLTLPMGTLVARVTPLAGEPSGGFCMMFHAVDAAPEEASEGRLLKLPLSTRGGHALLDVAELVYLKAEGHYARAVSRDDDALCPLPLAELALRLDPAMFLKVHRSYVINLAHAQRVERADGQWTLVMNTSRPGRVPVSRAHIDELRHRLAI
jgi:hypothetical protein